MGRMQTVGTFWPSASSDMNGDNANMIGESDAYVATMLV